MSGLELMKKYKLPRYIKVVVKVTREGSFFAYLPDYPGCLTEANDIIELIKNVTDAILTYFNVPKKVAEKLNLMYFPPELNTQKKEPIDRLVDAQKKGQEYDNVAVRFNYFTTLNNPNGSNSYIR